MKFNKKKSIDRLEIDKNTIKDLQKKKDKERKIGKTIRKASIRLKSPSTKIW
jgi:hypothetical protein